MTVLSQTASAQLSPEHESLRRRYSDEALRSIPKLLTLVDRNPYSKTYGCFDRAYWHYRTMDFPCGMAQEFCLPLALAWKHAYPNNPFHHQERMKEIALAGVDFARKSSHADGSCDDYFPNERALGALVFSLYATTETSLVIEDKRPEFLEFFARRGDWLLKHNESGQLANHQAFAALALHNVHILTGESRFAQGRDRYLDIVKSWQSDEGWFQEYEGSDPGYHSCSISFLGKLYQKTKDTEVGHRILTMLQPAVDFAWHFMHPDGSYAGEYGSRNTYHFYPHGFEIMAPHNAKAGQIADQFLRAGLPKGTRYFNDDDRMCAHYVYDWFRSYLDFHPERPAPINERPNFHRYFPKAKIFVSKSDSQYSVLSLAKGGVLKVTDEQGPIGSDSGLIGKLEDGRVLVSHLVDDYEVQIKESNDATSDGFFWEASVAGALCERRFRLPSPFKQVLFRMLNLTVGRFASDLLRSVLQKILITGKPRTDYRFRRVIRFAPDRVELSDEITMPSGGSRFVSLHAGSDATSIYVANSNTYQRSVLVPWTDLTNHVASLNTEGRVDIQRTIHSRSKADTA